MTWLPLPAVDVLWELLGCCGPGDRPYPFDVPHHGGTALERGRVRSSALAELERRGLARGGRPEPEVADALRVLGRGEQPAVAAVALLDRDRDAAPLRARAVGDGHRWVLGVLDDSGLRLSWVRPAAVPVEVTALIPDCHPGPGRSTVLAEPPPRAESYLVGGAPRTSPAVEAVARRPRARIGQFSVTRGVGPATCVSWFDTDLGRYLTYGGASCDGGTWTVHSPADNARLATTLGDLLGPHLVD